MQMMNLLKGVVFHNLKGAPGWFGKVFTKIDVARVCTAEKHKRLFCILDRDKPYKLKISYYDQVNGSALINTITKRYATVAEVDDEIDQIQTKISKLDMHVKTMCDAIINDTEV